MLNNLTTEAVQTTRSQFTGELFKIFACKEISAYLSRVQKIPNYMVLYLHYKKIV